MGLLYVIMAVPEHGLSTLMMQRRLLKWTSRDMSRHALLGQACALASPWTASLTLDPLRCAPLRRVSAAPPTPPPQARELAPHVAADRGPRERHQRLCTGLSAGGADCRARLAAARRRGAAIPRPPRSLHRPPRPAQAYNMQLGATSGDAVGEGAKEASLANVGELVGAVASNAFAALFARTSATFPGAVSAVCGALQLAASEAAVPALWPAAASTKQE